MAIPDYQACMLPLLKLAEDGKEHKMSDANDTFSEPFGLSGVEKEALLPSGTQIIIYNRIGWARTYLHKAGLLDTPKRGYFQITGRGRELLKQKPKEINIDTLNRYDEFKSFRTAHKDRVANRIKNEGDSYGTPEEALEYGYQRINENLSEELLKTVQSCSPAFFERLVVDLMVKMVEEVPAKRRAKCWARAATAASTVSSRKTGWGLILFMCRQNAGQMSSGGRKYRSSPLPCWGRRRERESSSPRPVLLVRPPITRRTLKPR
jgi:hypothetical protein